MTSQTFFVAKGRSIRMNSQGIRTVADPRTGRKIKTCTQPGGFLKEGARLPQDFVDYLTNTKESTGETKLQNMIRTGFIVFEAGASSPVNEVLPTPLPMERTITLPR